MRTILMSSAVALCIVGVAGSRVVAHQNTEQGQPLAGFPAVGAPPALTLISAGGQPRKELRFVIASGHHEHLTIDTSVALAGSAGDTSTPQITMPTTRTDADLEVTAVNSAGDMSVSTTFTEGRVIAQADTDPSVAMAFAGKRNQKPLSETALVSNRGVMLKANFNTARIANPRFAQPLVPLQQILQTLSPPLPEEPVGVGATWEVRLGTSMYPFPTFEKYSVRLVAMDETSCTLKVALEQTARPQPLPSVAMEGAALEAFTGSGAGTMKIRFDRLSPVTELSLNASMTMSVEVRGAVQRMNMGMSMKQTVTPGVVQ